MGGQGGGRKDGAVVNRREKAVRGQVSVVFQARVGIEVNSKEDKLPRSFPRTRRLPRSYAVPPLLPPESPTEGRGDQDTGSVEGFSFVEHPGLGLACRGLKATPASVPSHFVTLSLEWQFSLSHHNPYLRERKYERTL